MDNLILVMKTQTSQMIQIKGGMFTPEDMNQDQSETARSSHQCVTTKKKKKKKKSGNS